MTFAAVFVLGCWRSVEPPKTGEHDRTGEVRTPTRVAERAIDPPDLPSTAAPDAAVPVDAAPSLLARVMLFEVNGKGTRLTLSMGSNHGVARSWRAILVNSDDKPIARGELAVVFVDAERTVVTTPLMPDQLPRPGFVRLVPP